MRQVLWRIFTVIGLAGCAPDLPPVSYETSSAQIGTDFDDPLCGGDLAEIERLIERAQAKLGVQATLPLEIYLYQEIDQIPSCRSSLEGGYIAGCYDPANHVITSLWSALPHEIGHAVAQSVEPSSLFFAEALAEALSETSTYKSETPLTASDLQANDINEFSFSSPGHFARWLIETEGLAYFLEYAVGGSTTSEVYGRTAEELVAEYEKMAPYAYPDVEPCLAPTLIATGPGQWRETVGFSCESPEATQMAWDGASVLRRLDLEASGEYEVSVLGGSGLVILGCQLDPLDEPPPSLANGDVPNEAEGFQTAPGRFFAAGDIHTLFLTRGSYRIAINSGFNEFAEMEISIRARS